MSFEDYLCSGSSDDIGNITSIAEAINTRIDDCPSSNGQSKSTEPLEVKTKVNSITSNSDSNSNSDVERKKWSIWTSMLDIHLLHSGVYAIYDSEYNLP